MTEASGGRVSDKEKEFSSLALSSFQAGEYSACLNYLEKLEVLRPTDIQLAHNKIVAQCRAGGSRVQLAEVIQQLEGLARTTGLDLCKEAKEDGAESAFLIYNFAVAKFQQRHLLQAGQLAARLLPLTANLHPSLARKVLHLNAEICLALHQPEQALAHATQLDKTKEGSASLTLLKARCQVMARQTKALKKELKSAALPGRLGVTCEFVRSHIEFEHGNHRKSIKMLNSAVQAGGNKVFPHYYNNLGCIHQIMKKPNLAIYYFKNALEKLEAGGGGVAVVPSDGGEDSSSTSWATQAQILYNTGVSLLHAKRPQVAFDILLEVVSAHYLDPSVWFHLAECCIQHHQQKDCVVHQKLVTAPSLPTSADASAAVPAVSLEFASICLKNAQSLLPQSEEGGGGFCEGVGYIGNPLSWADVEKLRLAILAAKAYVSLSLGDFIPAGHHALSLLATPDLPASCQLLGHLYAAESLILQDRLAEAVNHLDPDNVTEAEVEQGGQYNLAVGLARREEWEKANSALCPLYEGVRDVPVPVVMLVMYLAIRRGDADMARRVVRDSLHRQGEEK